MSLKEKILEKLNNSPDEPISGQALADEFGVSRNAVWKAVKALQGAGYKIDAAQNKGYIIDKNVLLKERILPYMPKDTELFVFDSIDSTNAEAKRMLANGFSGKALIAANEQTKGRGRLGRSFYSPAETGVYMSYIFKPQPGSGDAVYITTASAVAVVRAIERLTDKKPQIKWVNDIYLENKKICGILTEAVSSFETGTIESVIIGIGINVFTGDFPEDIENIASNIGDKELSRAQLTGTVAEELDKILSNLSDGGFMEEYREKSMIIGKEISFYQKNVKYDGKAVGIDDFGGLIVETFEGEKILRSGEITVRLK